VEIAFRSEHEAVLDALAQGRFEPWRWFELRLRAERLGLTQGFERLLCLEGLRIQLYDHQREAVLRVLRDMRGRALLADEVGLGKTIEAGVILKEYMLRGLARKALILAPASLLTQWQQELAEKLGSPPASTAPRTTGTGGTASLPRWIRLGERPTPTGSVRSRGTWSSWTRLTG